MATTKNETTTVLPKSTTDSLSMNPKHRWTARPVASIVSVDRKTGARGLRSIMEGILLDTMFDLPSLEGVEEVVISKEVVEGTALHLCRPDRPGGRRERIVGRALPRATA